MLRYSLHPDLGFLEGMGRGRSAFFVDLACSCLHVVASALNESEAHLLTHPPQSLPINLVIPVPHAPE